MFTIIVTDAHSPECLDLLGPLTLAPPLPQPYEYFLTDFLSTATLKGKNTHGQNIARKITKIIEI
jgi:hypothetical protein